MVALVPPLRAAALRRARALTWLTIAWNVVEGAVALAAGVVAGSVSLVGFGLDSAIEVSASAVLAWRLAQEGSDGCRAGDDRRATRAIALSFGALAVYVWAVAVSDLVGRHRPEASPVGLVLVSVSLLVMPYLARAKRRQAVPLGSQAVVAEASQTSLCALLSGMVLVGLAANAALGWWWADPAMALVVGALAATEAVRTWRAEALEDTCCP